MTGIIGQDPRGRSGIVNQFTDVGLNTAIDSEWNSSMNAIQINSGSLSAHDAYPHYVQLNANAVQKDSGEKRVNDSYKASQHRQWDGEHIFKVAPAASGDISWVTGMTINNAGDIYSTAFTAYQDSASITGFSTTPTNDMIQYKRVGFLVYFWFYIYGPSHPTGSSGAGISFRFSLPYAASSVTDYQVRGNLDWSYDNSAIDTSVNSFWRIVGGESTIKLFKNDVEDGWTNAGNKGAVGSGVYQANSI